MRVNCSSSSACPANSSEELPEELEVPGNLELVFTVVSAAMTALLMFSLGCSVEAQRLWAHIRRPWGIAVGLLCQFGLMPLTACLLAVSFSLKPRQAVAVLIMGCCPGGTISNIFTFWLDGDMDLRNYSSVPDGSRGLWCLCELQVATAIQSHSQGAGVVLAKGSWNSDITLLIISFIFPLIGHVAGFLLAILTHQSWQRCRTISLETGAQNIQMCITMLQLSFAAEHLIQMLSFPLAYGLFQILDGLLIVAAYKMYKRRLKNKPREKNSGCVEAYHKKRSTSPKETSAFLEVNEEVATVTLELLGPMDVHRALEATGHISSMHSRGLQPVKTVQS
ncbi:hypothetical protein MC885_012472 [Smutsia gigantea]|nr:hypothetical protein MC885_012472 [Smutsia gigantea]